MQFKMQAIKITRKTYSIAVACLAPGFTMEPVKDVLGHYLPNDFALEYKLVGKHEPNQFFRVKRVRSHEREALLDARDEPDRPRDAYLRGRVVRKISREGFAR